MPAPLRAALRASYASLLELRADQARQVDQARDEPPARLIREAEKRAPFRAVYIAGPAEEWPIRIGLTSSPREIWSLHNQAWWGETEIHDLIWLDIPDGHERVTKEFARANSQKNIKLSWFDMRPSEARSEIDRIATGLGVMTFDELERQRRLRQAVTQAMLTARAKSGILRTKQR